MRKLLFLLLGVAMISLPLGCSKEETSTNNNNNDVSKEFGGFSPADEQPYFGDTSLVTKLSGDQEFEDSVSDSASVDSLAADSGVVIYAFRIVWGRLAFDSTVTAVTDWSGSLEVSHGVEIVRRTINFEPPQDYILPRTDRKVIGWVSKTWGYHDGILANVYLNSLDKVNASIAFKTAPFTISYNFADIDNLDTVYYLSDSNAVAIRAFKYEYHGCPKGFLSGEWGTNDSGNGVFRGSWMTHNGIILGYVKGIWGVPDSNGNPQNLFYGKYIDITGRFQGLIKGHYFPHPNIYANDMARRHAGGWFEGHFYDANGVVKGEIEGRYKARPHDEGMGFFHGRWKTDCPSDDEN